jgi:hypothetical protein
MPYLSLHKDDGIPATGKSRVSPVFFGKPPMSANCELAIHDAKEYQWVIPSWTLEEQFSILKRIRGVDPIGEDLSSPCQ